MTKTMLIDAAHKEETRVAVISGETIEDFDFETFAHRQLRGNIYLAKVTRVEPSLQAAFVEYGGNRHGFLAFSEIHPDYYQIPIEDREALLREERAAVAGDEDDAPPEEDEESLSEGGRRNRRAVRKYKIQEVIRRRQIMLVQVVKEERGTKGAALTSYISLAGRYGVLMPNTARGGGISRKISNAQDRKRLKNIVAELEVPEGMGLIVRTAGAKRTKTELKRDYDYLLRLWDNIRDNTLKSIAPALVFEEGSLVRRALRDLYDKDVDQVFVEGEDAYREAKEFVRMLMPSHAKKVQAWRDKVPLFTKHKLDSQLETIFSPVVGLKSGGYLVINQTEALVAIDVNSGKSTGERSIESTAYRTNLEAADEAARQMRLRDLAGLLVIDFIDMEEVKNTRAVEKRMKDALRFDRARVQMGKISPFGLLEISRQRRRAGLAEAISSPCEHCHGMGRIRSAQSAALSLLRALEEAAARGPAQLSASAPMEVVLYLLNDKRSQLAALEANSGARVRIIASAASRPGEHHIERQPLRSADEDGDEAPVLIAPDPVEDDDRRDRRDHRPDDRPERRSERGGGHGSGRGASRRAEEGDERRVAEMAARAARATEGEAGEERAGGRRRRNRRRRGNQGDNNPVRDPLAVIEWQENDPEVESPAEATTGPGGARPSRPESVAGLAGGTEEEGRRRRRRGRRGGRRRREGGEPGREGGTGLIGDIDPADLDTDGNFAPGELVAIDDGSELALADRAVPDAPSPALPEETEEQNTSPEPAIRKPARRRATRAVAVEPEPEMAAEIAMAPPAEVPVEEPVLIAEPVAASASPDAGGEDVTPAPAEDSAGPRKKGWWSMRKNLFSGS